MSNNCLFCKIIAGEIPCYKLYENEHTLAFMDINPVHEGHALVIPKEHSPNIFDVPDQAISEVGKTAKRVAKAVQKTLNPPGMNLLQCNGEAAKQSVMHFHMHVLPRQTNDGATLNWDLVKGDMQAIASLAEEIKNNLET